MRSIGRQKTAVFFAISVMAVSCFVYAPADSDAAALTDGDAWGLTLEFDSIDDLMGKISKKPGYENYPEDRLSLLEYIKVLLGSMGVRTNSLDIEGSGELELSMKAYGSSGQQKFEVDGSLYFDGRVKADLEAAISDLDPYSGLGKILTDLGIDLSYIDDRVTETGSAVADIAVDMDIVTDLASLNNFSMSSAWHIIAADSEARSSSYAKGYVYTGIKEIEEGKIISETGIKQGIDSRFAEIMNADLTFSGIGIQFLPDTPGQSSWSNRTGVSGTVEGSIGYLLPLMADMTRYVPQGPFRYDISDEINYHGKSVPQSGYYDVSFGIDFPSIDLPVITGDDFAELLENFIPGLYLGRILQILKTFDPTMDYNKFFNILLSMFPNVDVRFPIDFGEILMDKIPDLQYRYPFEKTDIPSFLFAGDSFKIPPQEADKIRGRVLAENDKLESLLYHVPYPVTFRDGDKVISEVMAGYGTEPAFPEYTSPLGEAAGWKFEDGTPWIKGVTVVKGETVLYPAYSKTVTDKPSAGDLDDADIIIWKKGSSAEELDLGFLDGTYGKVLIVDVNNGSYTWELPAVGGPYSGKTLKTLISSSDRESEISGKYESVTLGFEQAGTRVDGLLVSYNVGNAFADGTEVKVYDVSGSDPVLLKTETVSDGCVSWAYGGESYAAIAGAELPPAPPEPEKKDDRLLLIIAGIAAIIIIALAAYAVSRSRKKKDSGGSAGN